MDGSTIQAKIYAGYAKAAERIGKTTHIYRPASATAPLGKEITGSPVKAAFSPDDKFARTDSYEFGLWRVLIDGSLTQVYDYLVTSNQTYFIAAQEHLLPITAVECNRTVSIKRPTQPSGIGATSYSGDLASTETTLMVGWPCNLLQGTKGESNPTNLPGDVRQPWWQLVMPYCSGIQIQTSDIVTDDLGLRYVVSLAELTRRGWRIMAAQVGA